MGELDIMYEVSDSVACLTINREKKRNALSQECINLISTYLDEAEQDKNVRAVCLTGAGDKAFCSGGDLGSMNAAVDAPKTKYSDLMKRISSYPKPTVARVNGHCLAGGTGLLLACDISIATSTAKFGTPEVNVGIFPFMVSALLLRNAPKKKAMEMMLLGDKLTADQALEMGMLTRVVPPEKLDSEVDDVLGQLIKKSPSGIKMGKEALFEMADMPLKEALDFLYDKVEEVLATKDAAEGLKAFMEKREPNFTGE